MPRKGDICFCAHEYLGLITSDTPSHEPDVAGNVGAEIWTGIQLSDKNGRKVGSPWQSRRPTVVVHSSGLLEVFEKAAKYDDLFIFKQPAMVEKGGPRYPAQPPEPPRYAADGFFDGDTNYNGD